MPRIKAANLDAHNELVWRNITTALKELLSTQEFSTITLGSIAAKAGVARNTLYNYAEDKPSLILAVAQRASRTVLEQIKDIATLPESAAERVRRIIRELMHSFSDSTIRLILDPTLGPAVPKEMIEDQNGPFAVVALAMEKVIQDGITSGEFRVLGDVELTAWLLGGIVRAGTERMVRDGLTPDVLTPQIQDLVIGALSAPTSANR